MEQLFFECDSTFEDTMNYTNICLESAIFEYTEELLTNHYVTEAVKESLWTRLKQFFTKIILSLQNFTKELQVKIEYVINEKQIRHKLHQLHKELKENQSTGIKSIEMVDYWEMKRLFNKYHDDLMSYAKKFSKVKYTKTWQIEDDLDDFNKMVEKCNTELEEISKKKIKVSTMKALNFVEDEIRGKSEVMKTVNDLQREFSEIQQIAEGLKTKMNILGAEVIPKHVGFIQKIVNSIGSFIRKWSVKIIMGIVFVFTL